MGKPPKEIKRKLIIMDEKGRLTIPEYLRNHFGLPKGKQYPIWVEAYPDLDNCKTLFLKKEEDGWMPQ